MTAFNNKSQLGANNLTIIFGALAIILAFAAIVVGICQYRRMPSFKTKVLSEDLEMQRIVALRSINAPTRPVSAAIGAAGAHNSLWEGRSSPLIDSNTPPPRFLLEQESNAPPTYPAIIASKQQISVQIDLNLDRALVYELEPKLDNGARAETTKGAKDDDSIPATSYLEYELPNQY
ncbi:hypothetical protein LTR15_001337 [Elasticomyces elasticus]|nr:hypothetical protein LTR15_001337 [Elasticomyces elasticus]